jgi:hypothetical protein
MLASLAELELELGQERRAAAREARRVRCQAIGRPKRLDKSKAALAQRMHASGESTNTTTPSAIRGPAAVTLSVPTSTVPNVESDDVVDPGDAALPALLAAVAENTRDHERRDRLLDCVLTIPPLTEWPPDCLEQLRETCKFIFSCARELRRRNETRDGGGD